MEGNIINYTNLKKIVAIFLLILGLVILFTVALFGGKKELEQNGEQELAYIQVQPENGSTISPDETEILIRFDERLDLKQDDSFSIRTFPFVDATPSIVGNDLRIYLSNLMLEDNVNYRVYIKGLRAKSGKVLNDVELSYIVRFNEKTLSFLKKLPFKGDGYEIAKISDYLLLVSVTKTPEDKYENIARKLLFENGLAEVKFDIAVAKPSDATKQEFLDAL